MQTEEGPNDIGSGWVCRHATCGRLQAAASLPACRGLHGFVALSWLEVSAPHVLCWPAHSCLSALLAGMPAVKRTLRMRMNLIAFTACLPDDLA